MLHSDKLISNEERILAAVDPAGAGGGGFILIRRDGLDVQNNTDVQGWAWTVLDYAGFTLTEGNTLFSPHFGLKAKSNYETVKALSTFLAFMEAWLEADEDSENWTLFEGQPLRDWAETHSEEIALLRMEVASMIGEGI